jgi:hypothetical protein
MSHLTSHPMLGLGDPTMGLNAAQLLMTNAIQGGTGSLMGVPSHSAMEGLVGLGGANSLMLGTTSNGVNASNPLMSNINGLIPNTEESKRDMTLTQGGDGENDINIDLGKEL